ncbi:MAG: glycoside hydrolase family 2 protein [Bacteroidales bacterium]|nr:glycoside hydrolase family 2 protein [Bacteroidales bacterium]
MKKLLISLFLMLVFISCRQVSQQNQKIINDWNFRETGTEEWFPAEVPGCLHTDLMANNLIPDPFFGTNEKDLQWIGYRNWEYKTEFQTGKNLINQEQVDLVFEGIDTYAAIYLNDSLILTASNMFRHWRINCKNLLKEDQNSLRIVFNSAQKKDSLSELESPVKYPDRRAFSRKAPYHYGWDWGPEFVTSGIWRPVYLEGWSNVKWNDIYYQTTSITKETAHINFNGMLLSTEDQKAEIEIRDKTHDTVLYKKEIELGKGKNSIALDFAIKQPELWWTNGLGKSFLYDIELTAKTTKNIARDNRKLGIRTVELIQEPDPPGSDFYFRLNGFPVFMKGANYIPQDNFLSRVDSSKYNSVIRSAARANMNMLRVWGGGIYENDLFYDLCDQFGILVWQDFMFACNMYPGDEQFLENVKTEAEENIKRLRNHPCVALWCGNNEISEGWFNWGWQKQMGYSEQDSLLVWNNYLSIFEGILPQAVKIFDPGRFYWPSSPKTGWGHEQALNSGDMHYWGVWWGEEPFEVYESKIGRFMSEYGFQGFPANSTINKVTHPEERNLKSEELLNHQKHPRGMDLIQIYMDREYKIPENFEHYGYVSQLVQGYGMLTAIEAHRRNKPWCMGTLYWQLNDCWPVISWSGLDYYGNWKALHYFVQDAYKETILSFEKNEDYLVLYCVSDKPEDMEIFLEAKIMDFSGNSLSSSDSTKIKIPANESVSIKFIDLEEEIIQKNQNRLLVYAKIETDQEVIAEKICYLTDPKQMVLPDPRISFKVVKVENGYKIDLTTINLAKNVLLEAVNLRGFFSDNYFDMIPGSTKSLIFETDENVKDLQKSLKILTLYDVYETN